jgi:hypothetical protein
MSLIIPKIRYFIPDAYNYLVGCDGFQQDEAAGLCLSFSSSLTFFVLFLLRT